MWCTLSMNTPWLRLLSPWPRVRRQHCYSGKWSCNCEAVFKPNFMGNHAYWSGDINTPKKWFFTTSQNPSHYIQINGEISEQIHYFTYLGSAFRPNGQVRDEVKPHIGNTKTAILLLHNVLWFRIEIGLFIKLRIYRAVIIPVDTYVCENWSLRVDDTKGLESFDRCFC